MPFTNIPLDLRQIPHIDEERYTPLSSGYRRVILIENIIFALVLGGIAAYLAVFEAEKMPALRWLAPAAALLLIGFLFGYRLKAFSKKGYQIREHDLLFREGLWWQAETAVPYIRIQHVEVTQGPIGRLFGYSTLKVYTAGGSRSDLTIQALTAEEADRIKAFITEKISRRHESGN